MSYDDTSFYGDLITDEYDVQNNFMNPQSPFGYFVYTVIGGGFDGMDDIISQFLNDCSILSCDSKFINMYGRYWKLPRPTLDGRALTDDEYRIYLYLKNCRLLTIEDITVCFNNCMSIADYDVLVRVNSTPVNHMKFVDHQNYISEEDYSSNILPNSDDDGLDIVVENGSNRNVHIIPDFKGHNYNLVVNVEVPAQNWDSKFLELLSSFISVKGNVLVKEYTL